MNQSNLINKAVEDFENKWNSIDNTGTIYGKDNKIYLEENGNQLTAIKSFLTKCIKEAYQSAIRDVEKLECMKEEKTNTEMGYGETYKIGSQNNLRNQIKQQLQSLIKGEQV